MLAHFKHGTVRKFFPRAPQPYGFIRLPDDSKDIFFRLSDFYLLNLEDGSTFCFHGSDSMAPRPVRVGDVLYAELGWDGFGRTRAVAWCFQETYQQALEDLAKTNSEQALEHLRLTGQLATLIKRANTLEIGLTGNVSIPERRIAQEKSLAPFARFEYELLRPYIERERVRRQDIFRETMIQELGEDPYVDDL